MHKIPHIILILLIVAASSGCTGPTTIENPQDEDTLEPINFDIDGNIIDVKLFPSNIRAGEKVTAKLVIANTGIQTINNETVEIKATVKTLEDGLTNLALKALSDEMKSKTFTMEFKEEIKPGMVKPIVAVFQTQQEMKGRNLAGTYDIRITLSVNGQKVDTESLQIKLHSGKPRESTSTLTPTSGPTTAPTSTVTSAPTPTATGTSASTPTPTPTPEGVTVSTKTGLTREARIMGWKFSVPNLEIDAGDEVMYNVYDDDTFTIVDLDRKLPNMTVRDREFRTFYTTGTYKFALYYKNMRNDPPIQTITVRLNTSQ